MAESLLGTYIGRYKIEEMIGRGGMAEVYKAYQVNLDRHVAIKVMHKFLADDKDFLTRFEREARAMAATKHPNIVDVYDFDFDKDYYYIVMDYLSGGTLKNRIDRVTLEGGIIDIDKAIRIILELCDALAFAHKRGMVHRDIKPANIMFNEMGAAVLTDFGIARMVNRTSNTTTGSMIGTPAYMSPEQGLGEPGDNRSDIYSLGVLSYHLLTGQLPHEGDTPLSVVLKHIN
ncbi:MAG: protein kinase, partial [Chloroflexota bacterium]